MGLVQITQISGTLARRKPDENPTVEIVLGPGRSVLNFTMKKGLQYRDRKTVDYHWSADILFDADRANKEASA